MTLDCRRRRDGKITQRVVRVTVDGRDVPPGDIYKIDTRRKVIGYIARDEEGKIRAAWIDSNKPPLYGHIGPLRYEVIVKGKIRFYLKGKAKWGMRER